MSFHFFQARVALWCVALRLCKSFLFCSWLESRRKLQQIRRLDQGSAKVIELSKLAQIYSFMKNKVKTLGHRKKQLNRLSRRAPLDSFINFYYTVVMSVNCKMPTQVVHL